MYTEPGHKLHAQAEIGVDSFQADRSPTRAYPTAPLKGLWTHQKGGFYHDGRFAGLREVVDHYNGHSRRCRSPCSRRSVGPSGWAKVQ